MEERYPFDYNLNDYDLNNQNEELHYQDNGVLKNNLGLSNYQDLNPIERDLSNIRYQELEALDRKPQFNSQYYLNSHKYLFQDIYPWAGETRVVDIAKGGNVFVPYQYIVKEVDMSLKKLENSLSSNPNNKKLIAQSLANFLGDVNSIHPFPEDNGRTQRLFTNEVAKEYGYKINWNAVSNEKVKEVSIQAHAGNYTPLTKLIDRQLHKMEHNLENQLSEKQKVSLNSARKVLDSNFKDYPELLAQKHEQLNSKMPDIVSGKIELPVLTKMVQPDVEVRNNDKVQDRDR